MMDNEDLRRDTAASDADQADTEEPVGLCVDELARLPAGTILDERRLSEIFDRHPATIRRAVGRGEFPAPIRMFGRSCWTAGAILDHIAARLDEAQKEAEREARRLAALGP